MITSPDLMPALPAGVPASQLGDERALAFLQPRLSAISWVTGWIWTPIQPRATLPLWLQRLDDVVARRPRDREADADTAARRREDRGIHADDLAAAMLKVGPPELPRFTGASICRKSS